LHDMLVHLQQILCATCKLLEGLNHRVKLTPNSCCGRRLAIWCCGYHQDYLAILTNTSWCWTVTEIEWYPSAICGGMFPGTLLARLIKSNWAATIARKRTVNAQHSTH
jgi:hypothetical protein